MLLDFLHGEKTIFRKDLYDVITTNKEVIVSKYAAPYSIYPYINNSYFFSLRTKRDYIFFIDEKNKRIFVNGDSVRRELGTFYSNDLKENLGEYKILDIGQVYASLFKQEEKYALNYIATNYKTLFKSIKNIDQKVIDGKIYMALSCEYIDGKACNLPQFIDVNDYSPDCKIDIILEYLDNPTEFKKHVLKDMQEKLKDINILLDCYVYCVVKDKIKNDKIPEKILFGKEISDAIKKAGKTMTIYYKGKNGIEKDKFANNLFLDIDNTYFIYKANGSDYIDIEKIVKIEFNRKVLFEYEKLLPNEKTPRISSGVYKFFN